MMVGDGMTPDMKGLAVLVANCWRSTPAPGDPDEIVDGGSDRYGFGSVYINGPCWRFTGEMGTTRTVVITRRILFRSDARRYQIPDEGTMRFAYSVTATLAARGFALHDLWFEQVIGDLFVGADPWPHNPIADLAGSLVYRTTDSDLLGIHIASAVYTT